MWPGDEGDLDLIGGTERETGNFMACFVVSRAGGIDGETACTLAVLFRWAVRALKVMHRAGVNMETAASNNDSKRALFSGAIALVVRNLF